jgi:anti-sigma B factor antagonist
MMALLLGYVRKLFQRETVFNPLEVMTMRSARGGRSVNFDGLHGLSRWPIPSFMRITTSRTDGAATVVRVHSLRLDAAVAEELRRGLVEALGSDESQMVIDLSEVTFMDSSGLGALVGSLKSSKSKDIAISGAQPAVRTVLRMTRVDRAIRVLPAPTA